MFEDLTKTLFRRTRELDQGVLVDELLTDLCKKELQKHHQISLPFADVETIKAENVRRSLA